MTPVRKRAQSGKRRRRPSALNPDVTLSPPTASNPEVILERAEATIVGSSGSGSASSCSPVSSGSTPSHSWVSALMISSSSLSPSSAGSSSASPASASPSASVSASASASSASSGVGLCRRARAGPRHPRPGCSAVSSPISAGSSSPSSYSCVSSSFVGGTSLLSGAVLARRRHRCAHPAVTRRDQAGKCCDEALERLAVAAQRRDGDPLLGAVVAVADRAELDGRDAARRNETASEAPSRPTLITRSGWCGEAASQRPSTNGESSSTTAGGRRKVAITRVSGSPPPGRGSPRGPVREGSARRRPSRSCRAPGSARRRPRSGRG